MERLRGFRDVFPEDAEPRKEIFKVAERMSELFDFSKVEFPSVEFMELYRLKSGEELVGQTFSFTDKGGREVALTPEATPSVVRMLTSRKDLQMPAKWYSFQRYWRYEEPQSGRQREFYQFNADIYGVDSIEADSELIGLACSILDELGLEGKYVMRLNSREFMESLLGSLGVSDLDRCYSVLDKLRKAGKEKTEKELTGMGLTEDNARILLDLASREYGSETFPYESFSFLKDGTDRLNRLVETRNLVSSYTRTDVVIDLSIVRGLTYYTGIVFEAYDISGTFRSVLGGGRYDRLASLMADVNIPAVGFGMGDVILEMLMKQEKVLGRKREEKNIFLCYSSEKYFGYSLSLASQFRSGGFRTALNLSGRSLSAQLRQASKGGFRYACIIGDSEVAGNSVTIKDMSTGSQKTVPRSELHTPDAVFGN